MSKTVNDPDEGFTIVDETFGVREASESSDAEKDAEDNSITPHFSDTTGIIDDVTRCGRVQLANVLHDTPGETHLNRSQHDSSSDGTGLEVNRKTSCGEGQEAVSRTAGSGIAPKEHSTDRKIDLDITLNNSRTGSNSNTSSINTALLDDQRADASTARTATGWGSLREKALVAVGLRLSKVERTPSASEATTSTPPPVAAEIKHSEHSNSNSAPVSHDDLQQTAAIRVIPASPGAMIREAIVTSGSDTGRTQPTRHEASASLTKSVTIRVLPGDCAFCTTVPRSGKGSLTNVAELESELQRKLRLRHPVRLTSVQVRRANSGGCDTGSDGSLTDVPDGGTITGRPVDCVLVRARVSEIGSSASASPAASPAARDEKFVALSLSDSWEEAVASVKVELGVHPDHHVVEVRRISRHARVAFDSPDEAPPSSVCGLSNGDTLVLDVGDEEEEGQGEGGKGEKRKALGKRGVAAVGACGKAVIGGAFAGADGDRRRRGQKGKRRLGGTRAAEREKKAVSPPLPPSLPVKGSTSVGNSGGRSGDSRGELTTTVVSAPPQKGVQEATYRLLRASLVRTLQQPPPRGEVGRAGPMSACASRTTAAATATSVGPGPGQPFAYDQTNVPAAAAEGGGGRRTNPTGTSSLAPPATRGAAPLRANLVGGSSTDASSLSSAPSPGPKKRGGVQNGAIASSRSPLPPYACLPPACSSAFPPKESLFALFAFLAADISSPLFAVVPPPPAPFADKRKDDVENGDDDPARSQDAFSPAVSRFASPPVNTTTVVVSTEDDVEDETAVAELVGMGFDREHVVTALRESGRGDSWKEAAISLLLEPQMSRVGAAAAAARAGGGGPVSDREAGLKHGAGVAALKESFAAGSSGPPAPSPCPICLSDTPPGEVFTLDCKHQHGFCVDCLYQHCSVQLLDAGLIPACPLSNMSDMGVSCGHELGQDEVERVFLINSYSSLTTDGNGTTILGGGDGTRSERERRALDTCRTLLTRRGLEATGAVPCVSPECGNWMVPEGGGDRMRCGSCLTEFCVRCKRSPYHYAAGCDDVVRLAREWSKWLTEGKAAYLRAVGAHNAEHEALLMQHGKRKKEHDRAVQEAERLRAEYDRMEDWKETRCRCCPYCGRTIEKLGGCDAMMCGQNADGGNVQNGCGGRFLWTSAPPYVGDRGVRKSVPFTEKAPQAVAVTRHLIAPGIPLRCDRCHQDVVGPLFRCIHCPSFACCLECQDIACRDPRHVHHTFQVVDTQESAPAAAPAASGEETRGKAGQGGGGGGGACDMDVDNLI